MLLILSLVFLCQFAFLIGTNDIEMFNGVVSAYGLDVDFRLYDHMNACS